MIKISRSSLLVSAAVLLMLPVFCPRIVMALCGRQSNELAGIFLGDDPRFRSAPDVGQSWLQSGTILASSRNAKAKQIEVTKDVLGRVAFTIFHVLVYDIEADLGFAHWRGNMQRGLEALEPRTLFSVSILGREPGPVSPNLSVISVSADPSIVVSPLAAIVSINPATQRFLGVGPKRLTAETMSSSQVLLTWENNPANNATSFEVLRSTDGVDFDEVTKFGASVTSYTDSNLAASTQYFYVIAAVNNAGNASFGGIVRATTAALILPEAGFSKPTVPDPSVQNLDPTQAGYNEPAIANWDVVPYQTFSGLFNVGVVAFDMNGIKEVDFSVNGGAWIKVTQMTLNPQTANQSGVGNANAGVVEYWATLDASTFAADGQIQVRAVAYPTNGQALVLGSLMLNADAHHTLPSLAVYVSPTGSDSTGNGTATDPFASIARAANYYTNGTPMDGATIYLEPGTYQLTSVVYHYPNTSTGWLTVTTAPGVNRSQVIISGNGGATVNNWGLRTKLMHFENITFAPQTAAEQSIFRSTLGTGSSLWIDGCVLIGPGQTVDAQWLLDLPNASTYVTDTSESLCRDGIAGCLVRGVAISDIGSDAFSDSGTVINSSVTGTNNTGTGFHPDGYQFSSGQSNVIIYGVTEANGGSGGGQGIFSASGVSIQDVAIVNCNINNQLQPNVANVFMFGGPTTNMFVLNSTFTGGALWRTDFSFTATDIVLDNTIFSIPPVSPTGQVVLGVTVIQ